ncbi:MAG: ion channel [Gammaproteobacteria bacterium]
MNKPTRIHFLLSGLLALVSFLSLVFGWSGLLSGLVVILVNLYLLAILFEAAHRAAAKNTMADSVSLVKSVYYFPFPTKSWTVILIIFMVIATLCGFANMYLYSAEIVYVGPSIEMATANTGFSVTIPPPSILVSKIEAVYFSLVTMITLGYGDFIPASTDARLLVIWQLTTGGLFVIAIFPLITARLANF